jgi:hypothetical protein
LGRALFKTGLYYAVVAGEYGTIIAEESTLKAAAACITGVEDYVFAVQNGVRRRLTNEEETVLQCELHKRLSGLA